MNQRKIEVGWTGNCKKEAAPSYSLSEWKGTFSLELACAEVIQKGRREELGHPLHAVTCPRSPFPSISIASLAGSQEETENKRIKKFWKLPI